MWGGVITFLTGITQGPRNLLPLLTCCTCFLMVNGGGGCDNVLDEYNTRPRELVAVVDMCLTRSRRLHAPTIFGRGRLPKAL